MVTKNPEKGIGNGKAGRKQTVGVEFVILPPNSVRPFASLKKAAKKTAIEMAYIIILL